MNLLVSIFLESYLSEWQKAKFDSTKKLERFKSLSTNTPDSESAIDSSGIDIFVIGAANHDRVQVCCTCTKPLNWLTNPKYECDLSHKICCGSCCRLYLEPRMDIDAASGTPSLHHYSVSIRGYEPTRMETNIRKKLVKKWESDVSFRATEFMRQTNGGDGDGAGRVLSMRGRKITFGGIEEEPSSNADQTGSELTVPNKRIASVRVKTPATNASGSESKHIASVRIKNPVIDGNNNSEIGDSSTRFRKSSLTTSLRNAELINQDYDNKIAWNNEENMEFASAAFAEAEQLETEINRTVDMFEKCDDADNRRGGDQRGRDVANTDDLGNDSL